MQLGRRGDDLRRTRVAAEHLHELVVSRHWGRIGVLENGRPRRVAVSGPRKMQRTCRCGSGQRHRGDDGHDRERRCDTSPPRRRLAARHTGQAFEIEVGDACEARELLPVGLDDVARDVVGAGVSRTCGGRGRQRGSAGGRASRRADPPADVRRQPPDETGRRARPPHRSLLTSRVELLIGMFCVLTPISCPRPTRLFLFSRLQAGGRGAERMSR